MYKEMFKNLQKVFKEDNKSYRLLEMQVILKSTYFLLHWRYKADSMWDPEADNQSHHG